MTRAAIVFGDAKSGFRGLSIVDCIPWNKVGSSCGVTDNSRCLLD